MYQRAYFEYPATQAAVAAAAAIDRLKKALAGDYPPPVPKAMLERPAQWLAVKEPGKARDEFQMLATQLNGLERDQEC